MKKRLFQMMMLVASVATFTLSSCSKDNAHMILGKWNIATADAVIEILNPPAPSNRAKAEANDNMHKMDFVNMFKSIEFKKDGICTFTGYELKEIDTETMQPVLGTSLETIDYNYTLNDDDLTLTIANVTVPIKIEKLTSNELNLSCNLSVPTSYSPINIDAQMTMTK